MNVHKREVYGSPRMAEWLDSSVLFLVALVFYIML
jgi:hypothetical protein